MVYLVALLIRLLAWVLWAAFVVAAAAVYLAFLGLRFLVFVLTAAINTYVEIRAERRADKDRLKDSFWV